MRWLAGAIVLLPLVTGGPCPEPNYPDIRDCPFAADPNLVVGTLLDWVRLEVGQKFTYTRTWCDPEGDPADARIISAPQGVQLVNKPRVSAYTLPWTPRQIITTAIVIQVVDKPAHGEPQSATGTILVQVVPRGHSPRPAGQCGGRP